MLKRFLVFAAVAGLVPALAAAQQPPAAPAAPANPSTICGSPIPVPRALPPANSGPVVYLVAPCFQSQGNTSLVDIQTYLYYMQIKDKTSRPSEGVWVPYNDEIEQIVRDDFKRLWGTNFLDNLSISVEDYVFSNGVVGKLIVYDLEERQRVKIVDFVGSKKLETSKIDEKLKENNAQIRLDTFIDPGLIKKIEGVVREMLKEKGFQRGEVTHEIKEVLGGPKLVHVTFHMIEGPKVKVKHVEFLGNQAMSDGTLRKKMKENKGLGMFSWITGGGSFQEAKFEEDAERVMEHYRNQGYVKAQVGEPQLRDIGDSGDRKTHWVELRVPVTEGPRYKVKSFEVAGNTVVRSEALKPLFKLKSGEYYNQKAIRKGFEKAREIYGSGGYMEFTGYPDYKFSDDPDPAQPATPAALAAVQPAEAKALPPTVDVTLQIQEGKQYRVNRIIFAGNTTTRDNVIRREMRIYEGSTFDTNALQSSIKRLNQLGYFKALEGPGKDVTIDKVADSPEDQPQVDVRVKLEEQNRNQLTFGAGVSQFEGFFGQLSFQTANFLGRGESLTVSLQGGQRAQNYTLAFTEPFLFDRNITGGVNLFKSEVRYVGQFTQKSTGTVLTFGYPLGRGFTRMFTNYSYETTRVSEINGLFCDPQLLAQNPFLRDSLLLGGVGADCSGDIQAGDTVEISGGGQRTISKVVPSIIYNTVDQPIFPNTGKRLTLSTDLAGLGGNTRFIKPSVEGVAFFRQNNRMSIGFRAKYEYVHSYGRTNELPIFEKLFLGGEYSVRGFDLRSIGPTDCEPGELPSLGQCTGLVIGGNKSILFNVEQNFNIAGPVRLILFYDAGQVQPGPERQLDLSLKPGESFSWNDFKTSTGAEIRFFMPVLNVPFRLIFAQNPQRSDTFNNQLQPQKAFQFRFAVGTTF